MINAKVYYVSVKGSDNNTGEDASKPFRTIQKASDVMKAGDTCVIEEGIYEESVEVKSSGYAGAPVTFMAQAGDRVVVTGTQRVEGKWEVCRDNIYKISLDNQAEQVFVDGEMVVEARWPKMKMSELWDRRCWAQVDEGSRYGKIICSELSKTGVDWTGAVAVLNVAHQFLTWTRTVENYNVTEGSFEYPKNLDFLGPVIAWHGESGAPWEDDFFYLMGKLEALSQPGEWFYDADKKLLYMWTPDGKNPSEHIIEYKVRRYGFVLKHKSHIDISGIHFFSCAFAADESNNCTIDDCHFKYSSYGRFLADGSREDDKAYCYITGSSNTVKNSSFSWCAARGLKINGVANIVENCVIHDVSWYGSNKDVPLSVDGETGQPATQMNIIKNCTIFNSGNLALHFGGYGLIVEKNHVYYAGLCCKDVQLVGTALPTTAGNTVRYNWIHGCRTNFIPGESKKVGGLGIRGDDQTRWLAVHHNVVWDTGRDGIIVKGEGNYIYNNTVFDVGEVNNPGNYINLHQEPEPHKPFKPQYPLLSRQNERSKIFNNIAHTITGYNNGTPYSIFENMANNCQDIEPGLSDIEHFDFRPKRNSPAVNCPEGIDGSSMYYEDADSFTGAYGIDGEYWIPGCMSGIFLFPVSERADGCKIIKLRLIIPPIDDINLSVAINGKELDSFHINMEYWYDIIELALDSEIIGEEASLAVKDDVLGSLSIRNIYDIDQLCGIKIFFDRPMLQRENIQVQKKHHCIVAYK